MAIKITTLKEATQDNGLKVLVHGPAGIGKTVLCATTGANTLMISAEAGLLSIKDAPIEMDVVVVKNMDELAEVYSRLTESHSYEWIALDSITEIAEVLLSEEKTKEKDPRKAYGTLQDEITKILRSFRDLPINVVMTAKQQRFTDDYTGITTFIPAMPGTKLPQQIGYLFDEVFALRVVTNEEGNDVRVLQTSRDITYEAKDRSGKLAQFEDANLGLKNIYQKIHGE